MSIEYDTVIQAASGMVNSILGAPCLYRKQSSGDVCKDVSIVFDKNKPITDDFGMIAGYRVEANILKSDVPKITTGDEIIDSNGDTWRINMLVKETTAKWYVDVVRV